MHEHFREHLGVMKLGILFSLLTLCYGFGLGAAFGAKEDAIKGHLKQEASDVLDTKYDGDPAKAKKVSDKAWVYFKRAHLHANGLGATALGLILLLSFLTGGDRLKWFAALAIGFGSLGYSMYWMFAGLRAPGMGSTGAAKESLEWLAIPTSGLCLIGLVVVVIIHIRTFVRR